MRAGITRASIAVALACIALACSVGQGTGSAVGEVAIPDCRLASTSFDLRPNFFVADYVVDPMTAMGYQRRIARIRMQRGSYGEGASDGIALAIRDVDELATMHLGMPLVVGPGQLVEMTLYLGQSCPAGLPRGTFFTLPVVLQAMSGTITFNAIYAPDIDPDALHIDADFTDVRFEDATNPATRYAQLSGDLSFFYQRGRPAQHFP